MNGWPGRDPNHVQDQQTSPPLNALPRSLQLMARSEFIRKYAKYCPYTSAKGKTPHPVLHPKLIFPLSQVSRRCSRNTGICFQKIRLH